MRRSLTLFAPDLGYALRALRGATPPRVAALQTLLSRATPVPMTAASADGTAFELFGWRGAEHRHEPVAPVTYALDVAPLHDRYLLRADPVFIAPDRDALRLLAHSELEITAAEAVQLVEALNTHFAADGLRFEAPQSHRWYVTTATEPRLHLHPLATALGQSLDPLLPQGDDAKRWHGVLNEIQMLLHAHPVNAAREARGAPPVNSLWLWGGGRTPTLGATPWAQVWSDDALILGLAKLARTPRGGAPAQAREWLDAAITPGDHLVTPKSDTGRDAASWIEAFERDWIAPLVAALKAREINSLTLAIDRGARYTAPGKALERWWVRRRPLTAWT